MEKKAARMFPQLPTDRYLNPILKANGCSAPQENHVSFEIGNFSQLQQCWNFTYTALLLESI